MAEDAPVHVQEIPWSDAMLSDIWDNPRHTRDLRLVLFHRGDPHNPAVGPCPGGRETRSATLIQICANGCEDEREMLLSRLAAREPLSAKVSHNAHEILYEPNKNKSPYLQNHQARRRCGMPPATPAVNIPGVSLFLSLSKVTNKKWDLRNMSSKRMVVLIIIGLIVS